MELAGVIAHLPDVASWHRIDISKQNSQTQIATQADK